MTDEIQKNPDMQKHWGVVLLDRLMDSFDAIGNKIFSARFLITVWTGLTYNGIVLYACYIYLKSMAATPEKLEAFAFGLVMGFANQAKDLFKDYFTRNDRSTNQTGGKTDEKLIQ